MRALAALSLAASAGALSGCVERLVTVRSEPPQADVYVDDNYVGRTPCEVPYTWYGTRSLAVEKKGYRSVKELMVLRPPWWQIPPLDFVTDVVLPFTIRDRSEYSFTLAPEAASREEFEEVRRRAAELREKAGVIPR